MPNATARNGRFLNPELFFRAALLLIVGVVYALTMARGASFWDCAEFIAASHILGIPHPPGTPLFVLLGRVVDVGLGWIKTSAWRINLISAVSSLLACLVVFETTRMILRRYLSDRLMRAALAFLAGTLTAFSATFWSNAVEAEVYGLSMFLLILGFWVVLRGEEQKSAHHKNRHVWFYVYLSFLGIGVHTNSMLSFPALWAYIGWKRGWYSRSGWRAGWVWSVLGLVLFSVVFHVESFLVMAGTALLVSAAGFVIGRLRGRETAFSGFAAALLFWALVGYSVQLYLPIRSSVNPVMDQNDPQTWDRFRDALERKQYGSMGMLERAMWRRASWSNQLLFSERIGYLGYHLDQWIPAPLGAQTPLNMAFLKEKGMLGFAHMAQRVFGFVWIAGVFAALWRFRRSADIAALSVLFLSCSLGLVFYVNFADGTRPDSRDAKRWNTEIRALERALEGSVPELPDIVEISGALQAWRLQTNETIRSFLRTRQGQIIQTLMAWQEAATRHGLRLPPLPYPVHREVRERDYFYTPAFLFWAILTSLGLAALSLPSGGRRQKALVFFCATAWIFPVAAHFPSRDRSADYLPEDYAYNTLQSVPENAILLTYGDNDTFPLWYAQMVEGVRPDVTVINMSLVQMDWYRDQIARSRPQWKRALSEEQIQEKAFRKQRSPRISCGGDSIWWSGDSLWRPTPGHLFVSDLVLSNWPAIPLAIVFNGDLNDLPGGASLADSLAPLSGLTRTWGMERATADSLLVQRMLRDYRYRGLERGNWIYQDAAQRVVLGYRYLWREAWERADSSARRDLLRLQVYFLR